MNWTRKNNNTCVINLLRNVIWLGENDWVERSNHQLGTFKKRENEINEDQFFGLRKTWWTWCCHLKKMGLQKILALPWWERRRINFPMCVMKYVVQETGYIYCLYLDNIKNKEDMKWSLTAKFIFYSNTEIQVLWWNINT